MAKFLTQYSTKKKVAITFKEPSLTDQSYKDDCDLGFIIVNYVSKGIPLPQSTMNYQDCTTVQDFESAMQLVAEAKSNFEQLPSKDRDRFGSVENYLDFISRSENLKESYEKGYIDPSTVDLKDVYPETYETVSPDVVKPDTEATVIPTGNTSVTPSTEVTV